MVCLVFCLILSWLAWFPPFYSCVYSMRFFCSVSTLLFPAYYIFFWCFRSSFVPLVYYPWFFSVFSPPLFPISSVFWPCQVLCRKYTWLFVSRLVCEFLIGINVTVSPYGVVKTPCQPIALLYLISHYFYHVSVAEQSVP